MARARDDDSGLFHALIADGRPLIALTGMALILSGLFALFLSATKHFLPHDVAFLQMNPVELCTINECRIVHFMIHDRVSFGGALVGIGILYLWLTEFPLRRGEGWAWWTLAVSGLIGFRSFLAYLGYGYLDTWHGVATLALLPCYLLGMIKTHALIEGSNSPRALLSPSEPPSLKTAYGVGQICLLATAIGLAAGGLTIMTVGMTSVFVPQDLDFIGLSAEQMRIINPNLVPLIAHDRAGFGGGVCGGGVTAFFCLWCGRPSRSLWQALLIAGIAGFSTAIGVHPAVGYTDAFHLAPAVTGGMLFTIGICLTYPRMNQREPIAQPSMAAQPGRSES